MAASSEIFVTVGTHPQQFDRLIEEMDKLVGSGKVKVKVFAQTGHSTYAPRHFPFKKFLDLNEFSKKTKQASLVITHAGEGNIGLCKMLGKKMIVIPRRKEHDEHTNDHQLELALAVEHTKMGLVAWNTNELLEKISRSEKFNAGGLKRGNIVQILDNFVKKEYDL